MEMEPSKAALVACCRALLRPLARLLLRSGLTWKEFAEIAKGAYVQVATDEFGIRGRPTNVSRVAILTGMGRREVRKQRATMSSAPEAAPTYLNAATRVLSAWHQEPAFRDATGKPRDLPAQGASPSFEDLWRRHGGDLPIGALLKELQGVGAVKALPDGKLRVLKRAYIPSQLDPEKVLRAGTVLEDFGNTVVHDLLAEEGEKLRFERRASNALVDARALPEFREMLEREGQAMLERIDAWLTAHSVDADKAPAARPVRLGVGIYHIQTDQPRQARR
jgi:hypothetical protein